MRQKITHGLLIGIVSAAVSLILFYTSRLEWVEHTAWDWRVRHCARPSAQSSKIKLIFLDQYSLDWGAAEDRQLPWPWPRQVYVPVLKFLQRGGAKSVMFDIVFTEQSQMGVDDDMALGAAIADFGKYVQAFQLGLLQGTEQSWSSGIPVPSCNIVNDSLVPDETLWHPPVFQKATFPIPEIARETAWLGNVAGIMEKDAIIRRVSLLGRFDDKWVPSLALAGFLANSPETKIVLNNNGIRIGDCFVPLDPNGRTIINYRGPSQTHEAYPIATVIDSELRLQEGKAPTIDPSVFKDSYVLVGMTAAGLRDLRPTPLSREYPGVEIHATALDNILANDFIADADAALVIACTFLFAFIAAFSGRSCPNWQSAAAVFALLLPLPLVAGYIAYPANIWLPVAPPATATPLSLVAALVVNYALEGRQRRFIRNAFKQYLSPAVIDKLVKNPESLKLGGELRELSIFFSDIQGFTGISETLSPEELTAFLNDYLSAMTSIIHEQGGTIDKYEGDAIIAFWNAPVDDQRHAEHAVHAALLCQKKLAELRPMFHARVGKNMFARIGINTGRAVVGNMGSEQRFDYTMLGDSVNLASRLEGINKQFGTYIMISGYTLEKLGDTFACREISKVRVVGRKESVTVYEPFLAEDFDKELVNNFEKALHQYYAGNFTAAAKEFEQISGRDTVSAKYLKRCRKYAEHPPDEWNGVLAMTEK